MTETGESLAGTSVPTEPAQPHGGANHRWLILAVIGVAQLMVVLDTTIINIALPSAQRDLGFSTDERQWVITAYSLAFGSLLLLGGRLSDLLGRRWTLLVGLLGFAVASALGGAAPDFALLVSARGLQGVFAAILAPAALSTLNLTFPGGADRGRALAVYTAIAAGGSVVGLIVGGMLTQWLSWRWCLYINLVFAIPAAVGVLGLVSARDDGDRRAPIDYVGVVTGSGGLFALVYGLSNAQSHGWSSAGTLTSLVAAAILLCAFVVAQTRVVAPLLPIRILADRNRAGSYLAIALTFCSMFGAFLFLTYYLQQGLGFSPLRTGLAFLPLTAGIAISAGAANTRLVPAFGVRPLVPTGMVIAAVAMLWLTRLQLTSSYAGSVMGPMFCLGLGVGMTFAPAINAATTGITGTDAGVASAMVNTSQQVGGAIGTAALSTVFTSALARYLQSHTPPSPLVQASAAVHGYTVAFGVSAATFLVGAVLAAVLLRGGRLQHGEGSAAAL